MSRQGQGGGVRVIRSEREMSRIWETIEANPARWDDNDENPRNWEWRGYEQFRL